MKKRSLFAAVAMLIVSAVVLTSATYAWFSSNNSATAGEVSATITASDGTIQVSADGSHFYNSVTTAMIAGASRNHVVDATNGNYVPVSLTMNSNNSPSIIGGSMTGSNFAVSAETDDGSHYTHYQLDIKCSVACSVKIDVAKSIGVDYGMILIRANGVNNLYSGESTPVQWFPINPQVTNDGTTGIAGIDNNGNRIMDSGDGADCCALGGGQTATNTTPINLGNFTAGQTKTIDVYIWAEGQHPECKGGANGSLIKVTSLTFTKGAEGAFVDP